MNERTKEGRKNHPPILSLQITTNNSSLTKQASKQARHARSFVCAATQGDVIVGSAPTHPVQTTVHNSINVLVSAHFNVH